MGLFDKLKNKAESTQEEIQKREQDYMSLLQVYMQGLMASSLGITNINMLPDLKTFKQALRVPTLNGKLGLGEKAEAKKLMQSTYGMSDDFFKSIDKSFAKNCKNVNQSQSYFVMFQNLLNDFIQLLSNHAQWKLRVPKFFDGILKRVIDESVEEIMTKTDWDKADAFQMAQRLRTNSEKLALNRAWLKEFAFPFIMIAKGKDYIKK